MSRNSFFGPHYRYSDQAPIIVTDKDLEEVRFVLALTPDLDPYGLPWAARLQIANERNEAEAAALAATCR